MFPDLDSPATIPKFFAVCGLSFGFLYALCIGPLGIPDETGHIYRAYTTSRGSCVATPAVGAPADGAILEHQTIWKQLPGATAPDIVRLIKTPQEAGGVGWFSTADTYDCVHYLASGNICGAPRRQRHQCSREFPVYSPAPADVVRRRGPDSCVLYD